MSATDDLIFGGRRCDNCGAHDVAIDADGLCVQCERVVIASDLAEATMALDLLERMIDAALDGAVHPDDLSELVADRIAARLDRPEGGGLPRTRRELGEAEARSYERRRTARLADEEISSLERQFRQFRPE